MRFIQTMEITTTSSSHSSFTFQMIRKAIFFLLVLLSLFIRSDALDVSYIDGGPVTKSFRSPDIIIKGTTIPFFVTDQLIFLPTDSGHRACTLDSTTGATGKVIVASGEGCSYSKKIRNAFGGGAVGLVIQWSEDTEPGINFRWGGLGIRADEGINMPTVEVLFSNGNFLIDHATSDPLNTRVSFQSGGPNAWKDAFDGAPFIVLFQVLLSVLEFGILAFAIFKFIAETVYRIRSARTNNRQIPSFREIAFKETASYTYYLVIFGSFFALVYTAIDPLHSRGIYDQLTDAVFTTFSFPTSFIATFLLAFSIVTAMGGNNAIIRPDVVFKRTIIALIVVSLLVFVTDLIGSILKGVYVINQLYVYIAGSLYLLFPAVVVLFFIYSIVKFTTYMRQNGRATGQRIVILSFSLIILYVLWLSAVGIGIAPSIIQTPVGRITLFFAYFFITALINLSHLIFVPAKRPRFFSFGQQFGKSLSKWYEDGQYFESHYKRIPISLVVGEYNQTND